ncbi:MAG TPA: hypothetical protein VJ461_03535 [Candidatus Nanoarchaeia archaeon]|nr:hypothetical protein [Candidatus Nanoarchaeia archaeon]
MNEEDKSGSDKNKITKKLPYIGIVLILCAVLGVVLFSLLSKTSSASSLPKASPPPGEASGDATNAGANNINNDNAATLQLTVDIPCPGHAPLITGELKRADGVIAVKFNWPNKFDVVYDTAKTSKQEILELKLFNEYPATAAPGLN